jgi:hypothetical protein
LKARTGDGAISSRYAALFLALAALAAAISLAAPSVARAQEEQERPGLLNRLFSSKPAYRIEDPPAEVGRPKAQRTQPKAARTQQKKKARVLRDGAEPPQVAVITKRPDARVVLVVGDFLGSGLAEGLTTAFTQNPNVRIVDRTSGSSGFVREDFHNWPEKVDQLITSERPAAIVVMIGANDRQQMLVDGARETVRSESWNKEYAERAGELAKAIAARKVPFLWVGMPSFKSSKTMLDMLAFNDIYRAAAASGGGEFVDIWDGFVDENGAYMPTGPDINGQPARLRANDGINLARPGKRKVAFYVEKPLYKLLGQDPSAPGAATALSTRLPYRPMGPFGPMETQEPSDIDVVVDVNELGPLDPARPVSLRTPALDGGVELLGMVAEPRHEARTPAEKLAIEGIAPAPVTGRADQSAWPQLASAATAMRAMNIEKTLNKIAAPSVLPDPAEDRAELRAVRSDVLYQPQPKAPLAAPPAIEPDRLEEVSPPQAAPAIAAASPPLVTPATLGKATAPDGVRSDPLDLSPSRAAPRQAYKRPKTIGPEPNRAPTRVPQPVEEIFTPAEVSEEIPSASNADNASETAAEAKAAPDTAPARAAAPSVVPELDYDLAPARGAPRMADPVPVAASPATKDAPTELVSATEAPQTATVPSAPVEPAEDVAVAKAVPSPAVREDVAVAPVKSVPSTETAPSQAPVQAAPTALPVAAAPSAAEPATSVPVAPLPEGAATAPAQPTTPDAPAQAVQPATPAAPAPPTVLPESRGAPAKAEIAPGGPAAGSPPVRAIQPSASTPG